MASRNEEETSNTATAESYNHHSSHVRFDLDESHRGDDLDEALNETDEFLELSTLSNQPSTSSLDSAVNGDMNHSRSKSMDGTAHDRRAATKYFSRWVKRLVCEEKRTQEKKILIVSYSSTFSLTTHMILLDNWVHSISRRKMSGVVLNSSASLRPFATVTTPKDFCHLLGGDRVINKVNSLRCTNRSNRILSSIRFWSRTMELPQSNVCVPSDVGPMKCFDMRMRSNLSLWSHQKICKPMPVRSLFETSIASIFHLVRRIHSLCRSLRQCSRRPIAYELFELWTDLGYCQAFSRTRWVDRVVVFRRSSMVSLLAVWAGWGHASENPKLPELLHRNGIVFIGKRMIFLLPIRNQLAPFESNRSTRTSHVVARSVVSSRTILCFSTNFIWFYRWQDSIEYHCSKCWCTNTAMEWLS